MKNRESFPRFVSHCHFRETLICWFGKTFFFRVALGTPVKCPNLGLLKEIGMADTFHGKRILRGEGGGLSLLFFLFLPLCERALKKKNSWIVQQNCSKWLPFNLSIFFSTSRLWLLSFGNGPLPKVTSALCLVLEMGFHENSTDSEQYSNCQYFQRMMVQEVCKS